HGVIDSPDIPLNVSRSYLQSDANVKKISGYITKKVADRLEDIFKKERAELESKWDNLKLFIEYGMLSDEKFCERAMKFCLLKNTEGKYFSIDEYRTAIEPAQTDKDKKVVILYATDKEAQYSFIEAAKNKGYDVLWLDCQLDAHFVNLLESKIENCRIVRVDSDSIDKLIKKEDDAKVEMSEEQRADLSALFKAVLPTENSYFVQPAKMGADADAVLITQDEFMRRYREMSALGGGMNFYGEMPASYTINVNVDHPLVDKILKEEAQAVPAAEVVADAAEGASDEEKKAVQEKKDAAAAAHKEAVEAYAKGNDLLAQLCDLALLASGMLKGKALSDFIARSRKVVEDAYLK
ncbi:MAG: molecular chaperone HtpG, partial [Bacteroidales bacterium]|nr:molecular chaperone HtpG [Bacteroidales bacterium]